MGEENFYRTLQVDPAAEPEVIDSAYRRLARKYHPDSGGDVASEKRMREINRAYEVIGDPAKRGEYDASLAAEQKSPPVREPVVRERPAPSEWQWRERPASSGREQTPVGASDPSLLSGLEGATIRAQDGTYLGLISANEFHPDSICNAGGAHGSEASETSIRNPHAKYSSQHSGVSAFNQFAARPPIVERDGRTLGYLTLNPLKQPAINPNDLLSHFSA